MAIKGAESKTNITKELLSYFGERAFLYNDGKEIRVNCQENGETVQIKITLTAAKVAVTEGGDIALPGEDNNVANIDTAVSFNAKDTGNIATPTESEKHNVNELLKYLGL